MDKLFKGCWGGNALASLDFADQDHSVAGTRRQLHLGEASLFAQSFEL
jgi:hypothetical protein